MATLFAKNVMVGLLVGITYQKAVTTYKVGSLQTDRKTAYLTEKKAKHLRKQYASAIEDYRNRALIQMQDCSCRQKFFKADVTNSHLINFA